MLIDTHAHLYWDSFKDDLDQVIQRAVRAGVTTIINVGVDVETSRQAVQVSKKLALSGPVLNVAEVVEGFSSIGIHPEEVLKYTTHGIHQDIEKLEQIYHSDTSRVIAVGECGLDFLFANSPWSPPSPTTVIPSDSEESLDSFQNKSGDSSALPQNDKVNSELIKSLQIKLFQAQIDLAKKLGLPLLVHCRDDRSKDPESAEAWTKVIEMVGNQSAILHCYSGLLQTTNSALRTTNLTFSFAGNLTYPQNNYLREAVKLIPLDRIVLETDCPFLPPQSVRGQRNEPIGVVEVAKTIAELKDVDIEVVARQTTTTAIKILGLLAF